MKSKTRQEEKRERARKEYWLQCSSSYNATWETSFERKGKKTIRIRTKWGTIVNTLDQFVDFWETATYPSPKLSLTLTSHLGQNVGVGDG